LQQLLFGAIGSFASWLDSLAMSGSSRVMACSSSSSSREIAWLHQHQQRRQVYSSCMPMCLCLWLQQGLRLWQHCDVHSAVHRTQMHDSASAS
jgi:hypothetical protein